MANVCGPTNIAGLIDLMKCVSMARDEFQIQFTGIADTKRAISVFRMRYAGLILL